MDGGLSRRFRMGLNDPQLVNAVFEEIRQRIGENNYDTQRWLADHGQQQSELGVAISRMSGDDLSRQKALTEIQPQGLSVRYAGCRVCLQSRCKRGWSGDWATPGRHDGGPYGRSLCGF